MKSNLTSEPHRSSMAVLVNNGVSLSGHVDDKIYHPGRGEDDEDDEKNLQVRGANVHIIRSGATDQGTAQDQNVYTNDPRQHPSPVSTSLSDNSIRRDVPVGFRLALSLTRWTKVVGQGGLLPFSVFDRHPAGLTRIAIGQTFALITAVKTHGSSLKKPLLLLALYETLGMLHPL